MVVLEGVNGTLLITPPVQLYLDAPLPVRVSLSPAQILLELAVAVTGGSGLAVIATVLVVAQPLAFPVAVTV